MFFSHKLESDLQKMKKITQCPYCKENELCLEVNDDEGVEEIDCYDALSEKKKGAQIRDCDACGANLIIKKQIEIDNKIQEYLIV